MRIGATLLVASATLTSLAAASQHNHRHAHYHKKRDVKTVTVEGPVEVAYVFEGNVISEAEVCKGIDDGTFEWAPGTPNTPNCSNQQAPPANPAPAPAPSPASPPASSPSSGGQYIQGGSSGSSSAAPAPSPASSPSSGGGGGNNNVAGNSNVYAAIASNPNVDKEFPDGQVDCSTFPSEFGAIPVSWQGLEGWTGIQQTQINNKIPGTITTITSGGCGAQGSSGDIYCSYACPAGYMKTQFPDTNSGTSVGGLLCGSDGKLHKTNNGFNTLCTKGAGTIGVENNLDGVACVCGTDYPGLEAETVPSCAQPGGNSSLAITDGSNYYKHQGASTSAQYYVNQKGTQVQNACLWGSDQTDQGIAAGNWASVVIGAGQNDDGATFLSLLSTEQNYPKKVVPLGYSIELQGDFGGSSCSYKMENGVGKFCSQSGCQTQGQYVAGTGPVPGCTVQLFSGTATYSFSE